MTGRVLVVDDLPQNVKLLEAKLSSEYYTVFTASSGIECLSMVKQCQPDIILLDVMMPEMDGFETCKRLQEDPDTVHIPVVMVTALSEVSDRVQGLESGASDFITKPIDEVHLFARVKSLIRLKLMLEELRMRDKTRAEFGMDDERALKVKDKISGNVLIIDDDVVQSRNIQEALQAHHHNVQNSDPTDALDMTGSNDFDLIIVNTALDEEDGLRLAMGIRSQDNNRQTPIMILVDEDEKNVLVKGLEMGVDDYILTPLENNELIARTSTQIRRKKYQDLLRESYEENLTAAVVDSLTKLYNRRYLDAHLANMVQKSHDKNMPLAIMSLDIDHFKEVNDKPGWGHHIGDEVLKEMGSRIRETIRNTDLATRPGGEEFVVIMPNTDLQQATNGAERTRQRVQDSPFVISAEPGEAHITVSIGVACLNSGEDAQSLLQRADKALYQAKETGRNRVITAE